MLRNQTNFMKAARKALYWEVRELKKTSKDLEENRLQMISMWNETKNQLFEAEETIKELNDEVKMLREEKQAADLSLQHLVNQTMINIKMIEELRRNASDHQEQISKKDYHIKYLNTTKNSCNKGIAEYRDRLKIQRINNINCHDRVHNLTLKLESSDIHNKYQDCHDKLRNIASKAYRVLDECNKCFKDVSRGIYISYAIATQPKTL